MINLKQLFSEFQAIKDRLQQKKDFNGTSSTQWDTSFNFLWKRQFKLFYSNNLPDAEAEAWAQVDEFPPQPQLPENDRNS